MPLPFQLLLVAAGCSLPVQADVPLKVDYALGRAADVGFRPLTRTALFYGPTTFRVGTSTPYRVLRVEVVGETVLLDSGRRLARCRSSEQADRCTVDFGRNVVGQSFSVGVQVAHTEDNTLHRISRRFVTLDAHPSSQASPVGVLVEHADADTHSPDHVVRLVRVQRVEGSRSDRRVRYLNDLGPESFRVKVKGLEGARILSVRPPNDAAPLSIPVLLDVTPYLVAGVGRSSSPRWNDEFDDFVGALTDGFREAARHGVDAEYVLVAYAATGRVFGPFRLIPGADLTGPDSAANDATLERLEQFLTRPPRSEWIRRERAAFVEDFGGVVHTLNDIYLREFEGFVQGLWITGESISAREHPRFREDLWPERLTLLNPEWNETSLEDLLQRLDEGAGVHQQALNDFVASLDNDAPLAAARLPEFLREIDPGATETLHPHAVDPFPVLNALVVSGQALVSDRATRVSTFVRQDYAGEVFHLASEDVSRPESGALLEAKQTVGAATVAHALATTHRQLRNSYVVNVKVPNPYQNGARHRLVLRLVDGKEGKTTKGFDLSYAPFYSSSHSLQRRLGSYLGSPFKTLRLLSAYEVRKYWSSDALYEARAERWREERDPQVRAVLFESWVAINLKRLQSAGSGSAPERRSADAYKRLQQAGELAEEFPNPDLARVAATVARWFVSDRP